MIPNQRVNGKTVRLCLGRCVNMATLLPWEVQLEKSTVLGIIEADMDVIAAPAGWEPRSPVQLEDIGRKDHRNLKSISTREVLNPRSSAGRIQNVFDRPQRDPQSASRAGFVHFVTLSDIFKVDEHSDFQARLGRCTKGVTKALCISETALFIKFGVWIRGTRFSVVQIRPSVTGRTAFHAPKKSAEAMLNEGG